MGFLNYPQINEVGNSDHVGRNVVIFSSYFYAGIGPANKCTLNITAVFASWFSQKRGMDSNKKIPYYPFRGDGKVILEAIEDAVEEYLDL